VSHTKKTREYQGVGQASATTAHAGIIPLILWTSVYFV